MGKRMVENENSMFPRMFLNGKDSLSDVDVVSEIVAEFLVASYVA